MEDAFYMFFGVSLFLGMIFLLRWIGAWMLRIDKVINVLEDILTELKSKN